MLKKIAQTLFIINEPIGRLTYFKYCMAVCVVFLLLSYLSAGISLYLFYLFLSLLFIICYILGVKRAWDIIGKRTPAIILMLLYAVCILFAKKIVICKAIKCIFSLVLIFAKGQITGKKQRVDDTTQENVENVEKS